MNKKVTISIKDKKFNFTDKFVWRQGFDLYLTINEINFGETSIKNTECASSVQTEFLLYKDDYKKALEKYNKLKMFM